MRWTFSKHAEERVIELKFTAREVLDCLEHPEVTYTQLSRGTGVIYQRGHVSLVVNPDLKVVITALLRRTDRWEHGTDTAGGTQ